MGGRTHATSSTRRGWLLALLCPVLLGMAGTQARADSRLDFNLKNRLGVTIRSIYASPHQARVWEEDILGARTLADGQDIRIRFSQADADRGDIWDIKIITSDGNTYIWQSPGFKLNQISEITAFMKGGQAIASSK